MDFVSHLLCRLLWLANSDPPNIGRQDFYAIKHRLLKRFAIPEGFDVQHIRKECYGCDGTGIYADSGRQCRRCWGSGAYSETWWELDRWVWHGRVFHIPGRRLGSRPDAPVATIEGYVRHRHNLGRFPHEAALWLALVFDRGLFCRLMTGGSPCGWTGLPLCTLNQAVFGVAMHWKHCMQEFRRRRRPSSWGRGWDVFDDTPF